MTSTEGRLYARVCAIYGVDPAAHLDPIAAHDLRAAFLIAQPKAEPVAEVDTRPGIVTDLEAQMAALEAKFR